MIKKLFISIAFLIVVMAQPSLLLANQQIVGGADFENLFFDLVTKDAPWPINDLVVENFFANPSSLSLPAGSMEFKLLNQVHNAYLGKKKLAVAVFVDGREYAKVTLIGRLKLVVEAVVTTRRLARHQVLTAEDVKVVRLDISQIAGDLLPAADLAIGQRLKRSMRAGSPLFADLLEPQPLVKRGDRVMIEAKSGVITVTVPGEVRSSGARGDSVRVKNLMSRREVYAKVLDERTVQVMF